MEDTKEFPSFLGREREKKIKPSERDRERKYTYIYVNRVFTVEKSNSIR